MCPLCPTSPPAGCGEFGSMPHGSSLSVVFAAATVVGTVAGTWPPFRPFVAAFPVAFPWAQLGTAAVAVGAANKLSRSSIARPSVILFAVGLGLVAGNANGLQVLSAIRTASSLWGFVVDMCGDRNAAVLQARLAQAVIPSHDLLS